MKAVVLIGMLMSIPLYEYDVYRVDPCVEAMRQAMSQMEEYMPQQFFQRDGYWYSVQQFTDEGRSEFEQAKRNWTETKLQCWRAE